MSKLLKTYLSPLKIFKKLNGNLLVPLNFVVNSSINNPAWPSQFHDMKLGVVVQRIRKDFKNNKLSEDDLTELAKIDFIPDAKQYHSDNILLGFREYKRVKGDCNLLRNYVVPKTVEWPQALHGLKLGGLLDHMRQNAHSHKSIRGAVSELGFNLIATENNGAKFQRTFSGLAAYKAIHGDVNIVQDFVVPHGDARYPENTWGMKLGRNLMSIRCRGAYLEHRAQLEALGVNYEVKPVRREPFDVIYFALESYKAIHGDVNIAQDFVVPHCDARYPENTWGMKLGQNLMSIRCKGSWAEYRAQLEALGVNFEVKPVRPFDVIFSALESYKAIHGDVNIVQDFVVPHGDARYPENTWGMKLGNMLSGIRCNGAWSEHRAQLEALGVNYELINKHHDFDVIYSALESYKAIHGDVYIVKDFVVPHGDARYPENTWGMKLGQNLMSIRCRGAWSEHRAPLEALGVNYEVKPKRNEPFLVIYSALESYKATHGDVSIVQDFVVPHGDARYPENTWGMNLGKNLYSIRCQGTWSEHRAQLEALGVNFEVKPVRNEPFDVIYSALESYKAIHGHVRMRQKFIVPVGDARYPENSWGMNMGWTLTNIRCKSAYSEHRAQLSALGVFIRNKRLKRE